MRLGINLEDYPQLIADAERDIFELGIQQSVQIGKCSDYLVDIDSEIASDSTLRNEQQRKAKRAELIASHEHLSGMQTSVARQQRKIESKKIELNQLRNEFTVLKLRIREKIASQQIQSEQPLLSTNGQTFTS